MFALVDNRPEYVIGNIIICNWPWSYFLLNYGFVIGHPSHPSHGIPFSSSQKTHDNNGIILHATRGGFLVNRGSWAPLFCKKLGAKVMKKELNYLTQKRWEKVGRQELGSTLYKQEMNPWGWFLNYRELSVILDGQLFLFFLRRNSWAQKSCMTLIASLGLRP
jgi:hypothetical protein